MNNEGVFPHPCCRDLHKAQDFSRDFFKPRRDSFIPIYLFVAALLACLNSPASAQTVNICDRSDRVQQAILASLTPTPACASVGTGQMASITALTVTSGGTGVQLQAGDFADMPNLQSLDLRNNGIRVLPERLLDGVPAALSYLDIRGNPVTRIPVQVLADWDDGASSETLFVDPEDRIAGFQYRADGTTVSRLVLFEDNRLTALRGAEFQVVLPPAFPQLSERSFSAFRGALNTLEGDIDLLRVRFSVPSQIRGSDTVQDKSIIWTPDGDFEEETTERTLVWEWADSRVFWSEGSSNRLRVEAFPVEVRENFVLRDGDTRPNRIEVGSPGGSPVIGWRAQPVPSASAAVASGLTYEYALMSDAGGLFTINTANGALLLASGQSLNTPGTHHVVVMATAAGPRLALATTAQAAIEAVVGVNICARTEAVRRAILAATEDEDICSMVRRSQLASIRALAVTGGSNIRLQAGDFADMPNLQALDLRNNGIRVLPEHFLSGVPAMFRRLDIRDNPVTRIPVQVLVDWDDAGDTAQRLFVDREDRIAGFQYRVDGTTVSRLVLLEDNQATTRSFDFQVVLPDNALQLSLRSFSVNSGELNPLEDVLNVPFRLTVPSTGNAISQPTTPVVSNKIRWVPDEDFEEETTERALVWEWTDTRVYWSEGNSNRLRVEALPVEVRENVVLRDTDTRPNQIGPGSSGGSLVIGWGPQPVPSASTAVAADIHYEYALAADAGGLFAINTASGALSVASGRIVNIVGIHDVVVMVTATGEHLALATTAQVPIEVTPAVGICDRTPVVRQAILRKKDGDNCALIAEPLAFTGDLIVTGSVTALKRGDFRGVSVTNGLRLRGLGLQSLSSDVFEGIGRLLFLDITENNLNGLPADVLDHLQAGLCSIQLYGNPLDRLPIRMLVDLQRLTPPLCTETSRENRAIVSADGAYSTSAEVFRQPDYLGNIRYIDADTGRVLPSDLDLIEGERRRIQVELDALPGINGEISLRWYSVSTPGDLWTSPESRIRLSLEPQDLTLRFSSETTRAEVTITAATDDNLEHETVLLSWFNEFGPTLHEGTRTVVLQFWPYDGERVGSQTGFRTPPLSVRVLEPMEVEDTNPEPNRIWRGAAAGTGVFGWAPRTLVDSVVSAEVSYSLVSDGGGLFAIDTASGVFSTRGAMPPSAVRRHDLVVGATYRGAIVTQTASVEVFGALSLEDDNAAQNAATIGQMAGEQVRGIMPVVRADAAAVTSGVVWMLSGGGGLFRLDTPSRTILLTRRLVDRNYGVSTVTLTVSYAGAEASLPLPVFISAPGGIVNICDRTPAVQQAILGQKGGDNCALVSEPLEFGDLRVVGSVTALKRGDFRGVSAPGTATSFLRLQGLGLQSLSSDVFEGIGRISFLDISQNNLNSLPTDVLEHLQAGLCLIRLRQNPLDRLPIRLLVDLKRLAPSSCLTLGNKPTLSVDEVYLTTAPDFHEPDYLGNIRYIDADTGRVLSSELDLIEGERRRIQIELDALPGINGEISLRWHSASTPSRLWSSPQSRIRLSVEPLDLTLEFSSEATRDAVTITAAADDNREHETVLLSWFNESGPTLRAGTGTGVDIQLWPYDGVRPKQPIRFFRTPPLSVRVLEPIEFEDTNPEPSRIWRGVATGTGVVGWAPRTLVDGAVSAEVSYSLVSDGGGLFAIDTASGVLSTRGALPPSSVRRHDLVVGATYRGAIVTRTVPVEVFGRLSPEDDDVAQNAATVGQMAGEQVRGIMPVVRADAAAVTSGVVWALSGGGGLFRLDTPSRMILLTRRLVDMDIGVSTVTLTVSYAGAEASLPLPVVVSLSGRVNICDRTPVVQTAILDKTGDAACDSVSLSRLQTIQRLNRGILEAGVPVRALSNFDFQQMPGLEALNLHELQLESLPSAVFRGLPALRNLRLQTNRINVLPVQLLADLRHLNLLRVDTHVRVGHIRYRVNGEVTTGTLVFNEDESRDVLVEAVGGLHTTLTLTFQAPGAPVTATPSEIELGPSAAARSVRLSAVADADVVHNRSPVTWKWELFPPQGETGVQRGEEKGSHIPTPDLAVRVNETVALTDTDPAGSWLREDAADDAAVAGWSPQVTAGGVAVPTTAVSYRLTADAGGLFAANSATGALSLADGRALDYAASSRHTVTVEADYDGVTASRSVTIAVIDVTDICSRTDAVENAILAATPAADACGSVLVSELEAVTALTATAAAVSVTEADFDGLPNLFHLNLIGAGAVRLPVEVVANFGVGPRPGLGRMLHVDRGARISGLVYRDDGSGEVITPPLVLDEGERRRLRVGTSGVLSQALSFSLDDSGLRGVTSTNSLELGSPSTPTLELTALTDEDFNPASGMLVWVLQPPDNLRIRSSAGTQVEHDLRTEGLRVEVREADVFEDINPADNRISEASAANTAVSGWSPRVLVNGVQTTAVRYSLTGDAGGLFGIESASGALLLAGELDYEASTFHAVEVAVQVTDSGVTASLTVVVRVDNVPELSFGGVASGVISEAAVADAAVSGVAVSLLDDGVLRGDESIFYELTGEGSETFVLSVAGNVAGLRLANRPLDRETTPVYSLMLSGRYLGASISTRVSVRVANVVEEVVLEAMPEVHRFDEGTPSGTTVGVTLVVRTEDGVMRTGGVRYALTGSESFRITTGGDILVADTLDYEETTSHTLRLTAAWEGVTSDEVPVVVHVEDLSLSLSGTVVGAITESAAPHTVAAGMEISALFGGTTVTTAAFWALSGTGAEVFRITTDDGVARLRLSDVQLDYETTPTYTLTLTATHLSNESAGTQITVNVRNVVESVSVEAVETTYRLAEGAVSGTSINAMLVVETEDGVVRTDGVMYRLSGSDSFRITTGGDVVVLGMLDYEAAASHTLGITAAYGGVTSDELRLIVNVEDLSLSLSGTVAGTIAETAAPDTAVTGVEISALFGETTVTTAATWSLLGTGAETFRITTDAGVARLRLSNAELDYGTTPAYTLSLQASWLGETAAVPVVVEVADVNRLSIELTGTPPHIVTETAPPDTRVGDARLTAHTEDGITRTSVVAWDIGAAGLFRITSTGAVVVAGALDYETSTLHTLTITASWQSVTSNEERLVILVADVERDPQLVDLRSAPNTALNTTDARVAGLNLAFLTDGVRQTNNVEWIFASATPARTTTAFTINTATGVIRLNNPITAALPQTYEATVTATQTDRTASLPLSIRVVSGLSVRIRVFLEGALIR